MAKRDDTKQKLTIITNNLYVFAGGEKLALEMAIRLKESFDVTILNSVSSKDKPTVSKERLLKKFDLREKEIIDLSNLGFDAKAFGSEPFTLRVPTRDSFSKLARFIKESDIIYIISLNPITLALTIFFSKLYKKKFVFGIHNFIVEKMLRQKNPKISEWAFATLLKQIRYFHATSDRDYDVIKELIPKAHVELIPNFITEPMRPAKNPKSFVCLYVGRLTIKEKGMDLLNQAIARTISMNHSILFEIVGKGGDGESLVKSLAEKYPKNVKWKGFLMGKKLMDAYDDASLFLFPARYNTFGLVLLEAQTHGLPIITFNIKGNNYFMKKGLQGRQVNDRYEFIAAIQDSYSLWKKDRAKYLKLKEEIQSYVYGNYDSKVIMPKLVELMKV